MKTSKESHKHNMLGHVAAQTTSGMSQNKYCRQQQISPKTFQYWRRKYLAQNINKSPANFVAMIPEPNLISKIIRIKYPNGVVIEIDEFNSETVQTLIHLI